MSLDKWETQHRAVADVIRICGGIQNAIDKLVLETNDGRKRKDDRERERRREKLSKWRNEYVRIPLQDAIELEHVSQVSRKRLTPFIKRAHEIMRNWRIPNKLLPIAVPCHDIIIPENLFVPHKTDRPIIVSTDLTLISGLEQWKSYQAAGNSLIPALILDVESWLLGLKTLEDIEIDLLASESVAIGLLLKQLISSQRVQGNHLVRTELKSKKDKNSALSCRNCDKNEVRTDQWIAEMVGLKNKDAFHRAWQVCKRGIPELVNALNDKKLSFYKAAEVSKLPPDQQLTFIQNTLLGEKVS